MSDVHVHLPCERQPDHTNGPGRLQAAAGGVLVSDNVKILIDASFVLPSEEAAQA